MVGRVKMKKELKILEFLFRFPFRVFLLLVAAPSSQPSNLTSILII